MAQRKPVLHARDHLPGGADPLPALDGLGGPAVPPVGTQVPAGGEPDNAAGNHYHWWRFREAAYSDNPAEGTSFVVDSGAAPPHDNDMVLDPFNTFNLPLECVARQPGPNADSVSMLRTNAVPASNPLNIFRGMAAVGHIEFGPGSEWTIAGWFKFLDLKSWDVFNLSTASGTAHATYLLLNPNGSVTLHRDTASWTSAGGLISAGAWCYIAITCGLGRIKAFVNPGAPVATDPTYDAWFGTDFPFPGPIGMDTWGLAVGQYDGAQLAQQLLSNGFKTAVVQLNATPAAGQTHADYIAQLTADVAAMQAAGLTVVGWGEVDGTTGADLTATGVDGWMPQIEGDGQRLAVIAALGAGVGAGLPKAVVATAGGLDTAGKVADLHAAGITHAAVETYAEQGAYPYANVDAMLSNFVNLGWDKDNLIPMVGTYRDETPADYVGLDEDVFPNYGIYNTAQTTDAAWAAFKELNGGGQLMLSHPVIDEADPATPQDISNFTIGSPWNNPGTPNHNWSADGAFEGYVAEVVIYEHALSANEVRGQAESGAYGDTGTLPPQAQIPPSSLNPGQIKPGSASGQTLITRDGQATWDYLLMDELGDVDTTAAADGDTLVYDETTGTWQPGAGGGTDLVYAGVWDDATEYVDGQIVIYDARLWLCTRTTSAVPDTGWEDFT